MDRIKTSAIAAVAVFSAIMIPAAARAAIAVYGGGEGESCWRAALASTFIKQEPAVDDARWKADSIAICDLAISGNQLNRRDIANTWVNRGVLEMSRQGYVNAADNFRHALTLQPRLAEAHVNLGSAMMNLTHYEGGIDETRKGIDLQSKEAERAWYNLGIAYEILGRLQEAYHAYKTAAQLKPDWEDPKIQLARFVTQPATVSK